VRECEGEAAEASERAHEWDRHEEGGHQPKHEGKKI
jgi:hypothetical protein